MTKPEDRPLSIGMPATLLLIVAMVAVYFLSQYFGADAPYELAGYLAGVFLVYLLASAGMRAWGRPLEPPRLMIASVLFALVVSGIGFHRDLHEARIVYATLSPAADLAEISPAMMQWQMQQWAKFNAMLSEISDESAALTVPAVFDPTVMVNRNEIPEHREALLIYQQFATNARDEIAGTIELMEQEGMQRFPEVFNGPDHQKNTVVVRQYWDAIWGTELKMSGIGLEALDLMESSGYEVDASGAFIFPDYATAEKFDALRARAQAIAEKQADAEKMMQQQLRE